MEGHSECCHGYCCSDFRNHDQEVGSDAFPSSLTNDIHDLFDRGMFPGLTTPDYIKLEPVLKLASRMLTDQRVAEYIVTCTDGSLHNDHPIDSAPGPELILADVIASEKAATGPNLPLLRYPRTRSTNDVRIRSQEILQNLTKTLKQISIREIDEAGRTTSSRAARDKLSPSTLVHFPNSCGVKVIITISWDKVYHFQEFEQNTAMWLASHYLTARTLVHEIAHVLNRAANGWRREEIFYKNECCNESGFALEQALFGGFAQFRHLENFTEHGRRETVVISESWPTKRMFDSYNDPEAINPAVRSRCPLEEWAIATRVPWHFIASMFTDSFWDHDVRLMGDGPIEPSPKLSWPTKTVQPGETYTNSTGDTVVATERDTVVTCSPLD